MYNDNHLVSWHGKGPDSTMYDGSFILAGTATESDIISTINFDWSLECNNLHCTDIIVCRETDYGVEYEDLDGETVEELVYKYANYENDGVTVYATIVSN